MTQSLEDYLESIYLISLDKKVVRVKEISEKMAVKSPSVINAVRELKESGYLSQERYGYVELTEEGARQAKMILKKHTMLKKFLTGIIGVSEKSAEEDACRMEHFLTEETLNKIEKYMKNSLQTN
jgi:DtxR family transcriptional regulator, Mn-dependent transcriptional regulator